MKLEDIMKMNALAEKLLPKPINGEYSLFIDPSQAKDSIECGLLEICEDGILRLRKEGK